MDFEIAIIGGGASGLAAACAAADFLPRGSIIILERMPRVGKKILATGNGRCNLSNKNLSITNYYGEDLKNAGEIIKKFSPDDAVKFFGSLGVLCKAEENGRIYPYCCQASAVLDALRHKITEAGVKIETDFETAGINHINGRFEAYSNDKRIKSKKIIVAAGGSAYQSLGSNGSGYGLLKSFGHTTTKLSPALVPLKTENEFTRSGAGNYFNCGLSIMKNNEMIYCTSGEVLLTEYGLSGIPALEASITPHLYEGLTARLDFMPEYDINEVRAILRDAKKNCSGKTLESFMTGLINKKIGLLLMKIVVKDIKARASSLSDDDINKLSHLLKNFDIKITGTKGYANAQATAGGVRLNEFNDELESKLFKGLYAAGEILDVTGGCGGYNLHWAWASGIAAGVSAAKACRKRKNNT